jgi:hypothetical protein
MSASLRFGHCRLVQIILLSSYLSHQANYINALAVSVLPFFEPAKGVLGGFIFSPWVDFLMTLGELFYEIG